MNKFSTLIISFAFVLWHNVGMAQLSETDKFVKRQARANDAIVLNPSYTANFPFGNLKDRFGFHSNISMLVGYRMHSNWMVGIEGSYIFGNRVKETNILNAIITDDLNLLSIEGAQVLPKLSMEGFNIKIVAEKLFKVSKKLTGSGIFIQTGVGFVQHKILAQAPTRLYPQLDKTYRTGYDRLSNGALLSFSTGFKFLEYKRLFNINIGAITEIGFTQNRRAWNFDEGRKDNTQRLDIFVGAKIGYIIPIRLNKDNVDLY